jgi:hypothetical protein
MKKRKRKPKAVESTNHARECHVCTSPARESIEEAFVDWKPVTTISREYKISRDSLYRHAKAQNLFAARERNVKAVLSAFIERASRVRPSARSLLQAVALLSKINSEGQWIDRVQDVDAARNRSSFARMTSAEMLAYAQDGTLPPWWEAEPAPLLPAGDMSN